MTATVFEVVIVKLTPVQPTDSTTFRKALGQISIIAYDVSVEDPSVGAKVGKTGGLLGLYTDPVVAAPTNSSSTTGSNTNTDPYVVPNSIFQEWDQEKDKLGNLQNVPKSVATAIVVLDPPLGRSSLNLRLEYYLDGTLLQSTFEYNIAVLSTPLISDQSGYLKFAPATYFSMPLTLPTAATLTLSSDGSPPDFDTLVAAIDAVLSQDMSTDAKYKEPLAQRHDPLTAQQSKEIASVIAWNRALYPVPLPTATLYAMYTSASSTLSVDQNDDNSRRQFESDLQNYHTTHDGDASQLANFVFAASAAIQCEKLSTHAHQAGITFPVETGDDSPTDLNAFPHASVVLQYPKCIPPAEPRFTVPAPYFYVLGAKYPTQITADQRYSAAINTTETQLLGTFQQSIDAGTLAQSVAPTRQPKTETPTTTPTTTGGSGQKPTTGGIAQKTPPPPPPAPSTTTTPTTGGAAQKAPTPPAPSTTTPTTGGSGKKAPPPVMSATIPTTGTVTTINADQAARRLVALGATFGTTMDVSVITGITAGVGTNGGTTQPDLLSAWLNYAGQTTDIDKSFWGSAISNYPVIYLDLLLNAITQGDADLVSAIQQKMCVNSVGDLQKKTNRDWHCFFTANPSLLPAFTFPGDVDQRTDLFVQRLQKFFTVTSGTGPSPSPNGAQNGGFQLPADDAIHMFLTNYSQLFSGSVFSFAPLPDAAALDQTIKAVFPNNPERRKWLRDGIDTIAFLVKITSIISTDKTIQKFQSSWQFSLVEALYARGFTRLEQVQNLTSDQFTAALFGSAAYTYASDIYKLATDSQNTLPTASVNGVDTFAPVNADGSLVDYLPPQNLSPLGAVAYLHELLALPLGQTTLGKLVASRRGPLQTLHPSAANLSSTLPSIDLVNESLEALGSNLSQTHGAVHDTSDPLAKALGTDSKELALLDAVPEYSSPSKPASPGVYDSLKKCFTDPSLPYSQGLDVCSSNLAVLGMTRFDTMRHFRRDVTELPMEAGLEPAAFQRHLWRYPVRLEIALEFLNISPEEHSVLFGGELPDPEFLEAALGLKAEALKPDFFTVKAFLEFTGLSYGEFLQLYRCGYVHFEAVQPGVKGNVDTGFPQNGTSDLGSLRVQFNVSAAALPFTLRQVFVFIRLWRSLSRSNSARIGFGTLAQVCTEFHLFNQNAINPDFLRQLAALLMLRNHFDVPIEESASLQALAKHDPLRPKIGSCYAIWKETALGSAEWDLAVELFLEKVQEYAKARYECQPREVGFCKDLKDNLHQLSILVGFTDTDKWYAHPTSTIRFAEVLAKIYASEFTVGELIFLFTAEEHAAGDDPFPMPDALESVISPLNLPDDNDNNIWGLREKLISVDVDEESQTDWDWSRIQSALISMGYVPAAKNDPLTALGKHFFPSALEASGQQVSQQARRFEVELPASETTVSLWSADERSPFHYETEGAGCLWVELPLCEEAVLEMLKTTRQLSEKEIQAVQELYFAPRATLAPFAFIFNNFPAAVDRLIHEPSNTTRFNFFQEQFALFHRRCEIIADHFAGHVASATGKKACNLHRKVAWQVLRRLSADENCPRKEPWENDSGASPETYTWDRYLSGSSFSALLGLIGTGVLGEYQIQHESGTKKVWRENTGDLTFFGSDQDKNNVPVPTILPALNLEPKASHRCAIEIVNGFALRDSDERCLGGAQPFRVCWNGSLLIGNSGEYAFHVGSPRPGHESPHFDGTKHQRWLVVLRRGQKSWTIINHSWDAPTAPPAVSEPFLLQRGIWNIEIWFEQLQPIAGHRPLHTGFQVKYKGPDTGDTLSVISVGKLFQDSKHETLDHGLDLKSSASAYLSGRYYSTLRDIRRTYQRVFKGILFVSRYGLSAEPFHHDQHGESELDYVLRYPKSFLGTSYYRVLGPKPGFQPHQAFFDLNLLPVSDPYYPPVVAEDERACPSAKRQAALFDWWERFHDYSYLRRWIRDVRSRSCWMLFYEATEQAPKADKLLRYLSINASLAPAVLSYFENSEKDKSFTVDTPDLTDERWTIRVWRAGIWLDDLKKRVWTPCLETALPWMWSSNDPNAVIDGTSGNENLMRFVKRNHFEQAPPVLEAIEKLNNGLRLRAQKALLAYLCGCNRVALPFNPGAWAKVPRDLSDLLLQDVAVSTREKTTRIDDALSAVQSFVQRVRLGLEPHVQPSDDFIESWDAKYSTFKTWKSSKRRELYPENWIHWDELRTARKSESFRSLEKELSRGVLSIPKSSNFVSWSGTQLPKDGHLTDLQSLDLVSLTTSGSSLLGYPGHSGQLSLTAPMPQSDDSSKKDAPKTKSAEVKITTAPVTLPPKTEQLPLWMKAAVDMGANFIQVAAASNKPVATTRDRDKLCNTCQKIHAPHVDEFYFWLTQANYFDSSNAQQNVDLGATPPAPACSWDPSKKQLKTLLEWNPTPIFYLTWCRVRCGQFGTSRQSDAGTAYAGTGTPPLVFLGRKANFLLFSVSETETFVYDISRDYAVCFTDAVANDVESVPPNATAPLDTIDTSGFANLGPLTAYPFFIYFEPGAPSIPLSNFSTALSVASSLSSSGQYEAALKWYELAFDSPSCPLSRNNSWELSSSSNDLPSLEVTRERAVLLEYLEALQQWGNTLLGQSGAESHREALIIFNLLDRIMGCHPALVILEDTTSSTMTVENFTPSALPLNPRLVALYDGVAESLAQLHRSDGRNITAHNTAIAQRVHTSTLHLPHRRHPYRFTYLLPKAQQLAEAASSLGKTLLSALQTGDAEYLSSVQATQERQLTSLSLPDKKEQFRAADWDVKALQISLQKALCDLSYYQTLVRNGPSAGEQAYINSTQLGLFERTAAQGILSAAQGVSNIPDIYAGGAGAMGSPLEFQRVGGGSEMSSSLNFAAQILTNVADSENIIAGLQQTQAEWARRLDDWNHTIDMNTIDIQGLECQKLAADRRHDSALYELNATQRQIEHAIEVQDFLRDKTTAFNLYLFLQRETALLYRQTYNVALQAAREAQEMLHYELRGPPRDFVADCTWSTLRDGLVAGDKLALALQAMDRAYTENNTREHELSKQLSLSLHFPAAFLRLKATGAAEFAVPEWMFDLDYPGMYMRRIRSVSVTIPCVVGPYTGIHARLELQESRIRVSSSTCITTTTTTSGNFGAQSYECQSPRTDTRFVHLYGTREAIVTSSGLGDSGLFELNFNDDRYLPFEFAGAISRWRIELPPDNNEFDLATLTDFVITLNYTAREGGEELRHAAAQAAQARLPGDGFRLFDVKHELSDLWATLKRSLRLGGHAGRHKKGQEHGKVAPPLLRLPFHRNMFPFLNGRRILSVVRLQLFVQAEEPQPDGSYVRVRYHPSGYSYEEDVDEYHYDSSTREFDCVVNAEWPGLYHGVIDVDIEVPPAGWSEGKGCGTLTFPERMFDVRDVYILCQYKVRGRCSRLQAEAHRY